MDVENIERILSMLDYSLKEEKKMNKTILIASATFVAGAALGSVVSWNMLKTKYKQIADEEIESVKEVFNERTKEFESYNNKLKETLENLGSEPEPKEEVKIAKIRPYVSYAESFKQGLNQGIEAGSKDINKEISEKARDIVNDCNSIVQGGNDTVMPITPYVIRPDEFDVGDYEVITLRCYDDDVVTVDNTGRILTEDEIEECVGLDSLTHFGEYEDDSVFVRNDTLRIDYEILRDEDAYYDE